MTDDEIARLARRAASRYRCPGLTPDDLRQEACLAILRGLRLTVHEAHLVNIARRHLCRLYKRAARDRACPIDQAPEPVDDRPSPREAMAAGEEYGRLVALCTPKQQLVLELGVRRGMSDEDVAATLGVTENAVRTRRHQALERLRNIFAGAT